MNEASEGRPNHVHARPHIVRLYVPPERNDGEDEADAGEYRERVVEGSHLWSALYFLKLPEGRNTKVFKLVRWHVSKTWGEGYMPRHEGGGGRGRKRQISVHREGGATRYKWSFIACLDILGHYLVYR